MQVAWLSLGQAQGAHGDCPKIRAIGVTGVDHVSGSLLLGNVCSSRFASSR